MSNIESVSLSLYSTLSPPSSHLSLNEAEVVLDVAELLIFSPAATLSVCPCLCVCVQYVPVCVWYSMSVCECTVCLCVCMMSVCVYDVRVCMPVCDCVSISLSHIYLSL